MSKFMMVPNARRARHWVLFILAVLSVFSRVHGHVVGNSRVWTFSSGSFNEQVVVPGANVVHSASDPTINLTVNCKRSKQFCDYVNLTFQRAVKRITDTFRLKQSINAVFYMFPECLRPGDTGCIERGTIGAAVPLAYIPVRHLDDNRVYNYPTALLKQLDIDGADKVVWPKYDIGGYFSTARDWYFPDRPFRSLGPKQDDLEYVATHELLHGMGFGRDSVLVNPVPGMDVLLPERRSTRDPAIVTTPEQANLVPQDPPVEGWAYPCIWNRFVVINKVPLTQHLQTLDQCFEKHVAKLPQPHKGVKVSELVKDTCVSTEGKALYGLATTANTLEFHADAWKPAFSPPPGSTVLPLETGLKPFDKASSASHTALTTTLSPEFLMQYKHVEIIEKDKKKTIQELAKLAGAPASAIGPLTRAAMAALGYCPADGARCASRRALATVEPAARGKPIPVPGFDS